MSFLFKRTRTGEKELLLISQSYRWQLRVATYLKYPFLYFTNTTDFSFQDHSLKISETLVNKGCYGTDILRLTIASIKDSGIQGGQELAWNSKNNRQLQKRDTKNQVSNSIAATVSSLQQLASHSLYLFSSLFLNYFWIPWYHELSKFG